MIKLTQSDGPIWVNGSKIIAIYTEDGQTRIDCDEEYSWYVTESPETILSLL